MSQLVNVAHIAQSGSRDSCWFSTLSLLIQSGPPTTLDGVIHIQGKPSLFGQTFQEMASLTCPEMYLHDGSKSCQDDHEESLTRPVSPRWPLLRKQLAWGRCPDQRLHRYHRQLCQSETFQLKVQEIQSNHMKEKENKQHCSNGKSQTSRVNSVA